MRKIEYPSDKEKLNNSYIEIFEQLNFFRENQRNWENHRNSSPVLKSHFPKKLQRILLAPYKKLIRYYNYYTTIPLHERQLLNKDLNDIFDYETYQTHIAAFFMNKKNGFNLTTCHYCDMAYINTYTINQEKEGLHLINEQWTEEDIKRELRISSRNAAFVYSKRPFDSIEDFNHLKCFRTPDKFHSVFIGETKNHFDLDHALDKGSCPIVGLSLRNFVPSCQVCNEKLKRSKVLGDCGKPIERLSPTSSKYEFDDNVTIILEPTTIEIHGFPWDYPEEYQIKFDCHDKIYQNIVNLFKLNERYDYHRHEAIYWMRMKHRYPDSNIEMIAKTFDDATEFSEENIKEDLFRNKEDNIYHSCFAKMKKDILK